MYAFVMSSSSSAVEETPLMIGGTQHSWLPVQSQIPAVKTSLRIVVKTLSKTPAKSTQM